MQQERQVYLFQYNVPKECHVNGKTDHYITAQAIWFGSRFEHNNKPIVIENGPVKSLLTNYDLAVIIDWPTVFNDIERIAQDHFDSISRPQNVVQIAEQVNY